MSTQSIPSQRLAPKLGEKASESPLPSEQHELVGTNGDQVLIEALRAGDSSAMGGLYTRHYATALTVALRLAGDSASAEDLVQDAFVVVFDSINAGKGPDRHFRAYLLTTLRHRHFRTAKAGQRLSLTNDENDLDSMAAPGEHPTSLVESADEAKLIMAAFRSLPIRWQYVLWRTEVDGDGASAIASELGMSTNTAAALAYRARKGLAGAYLDGQVSTQLPAACRIAAPMVPPWLRSELSANKVLQLKGHLRTCERCTQMAADMAEANPALVGRRHRASA